MRRAREEAWQSRLRWRRSILALMVTRLHSRAAWLVLPAVLLALVARSWAVLSRQHPPLQDLRAGTSLPGASTPGPGSGVGGGGGGLPGPGVEVPRRAAQQDTLQPQAQGDAPGNGSSAADSSTSSSSSSSGVSGGLGSEDGDGGDSKEEEDDGVPGPTAVCLVGGARSFEATGPSIVQHVLQTYSPCDLFLNAPLDQDSSKLWGVTPPPGWGSRLVHVRVFPNAHVDEQQHPLDILRSNGSPRGRQGLLQYFRLVEGCLELVLRHERRVGKQYKWIARVRLDSYWRGPAPAVAKLERGAYTLPYGNKFSGLNDRFGIGPRHQAIVSMRRMSMLPVLRRANISRDHTSEKAYYMQFVLHGVRVALKHMPFCVLTQRFARPSPDNLCNPAVPSMASTVHLDGTKCLPCQPCSETPKRSDILGPLFGVMDMVQSLGMGFLGRKQLVVCNLTKPWDPKLWPQRFDEAAGPELAQWRKILVSTTQGNCVRKLTQMQMETTVWDSPNPLAVCVRRSLGGAHEIGHGTGSFNTFIGLLVRPNITVVAPLLRATGDRSWETFVQRRFGVRVHRWSKAQVQALNTTVAAKGLEKVDVLKLSAEGKDYKLLLEWVTQSEEVPVCQLLVAFPRKSQDVNQLLYGGWDVLVGHIRRLHLDKLGFQLDSCVGGQGSEPSRCLFYSTRYC